MNLYFGEGNANIPFDGYIKQGEKPRETDIREAIQARLQRIKKANGFIFDANFLDYTKRKFNDETIQFPLVVVRPASCEYLSANIGIVKFKTTLAVIGTVEIAEIDTSEPDREALKVDIFNALFYANEEADRAAINTTACTIDNIILEDRDDGSNTLSIAINVSFEWVLQLNQNM